MLSQLLPIYSPHCPFYWLAGSLSASACTNENPANLYPSALKNLLCHSTLSPAKRRSAKKSDHCSLSACKKHSIESMHISTPKETFAKTKNPPII